MCFTTVYCVCGEVQWFVFLVQVSTGEHVVILMRVRRRNIRANPIDTAGPGPLAAVCTALFAVQCGRVL
jgi:hypothetical protein